MRTQYTADQKTEVLQLLAAGFSVKETSEKTRVKPQTISNWKKDDKIKKGGNGATQQKRKSRNGKEPEKSLEDRLEEYELASTLDQLENAALRKIVNETDPTKRLVIEIEYLRERCGKWGDELVRPLIEV